MQVQLLLYVAFYASYRYISNEQNRQSALVLVCVLYFAAMWKLGFPPTWYVTVGGFIVGFYWAFYKTEIDDIITNSRKRLTVLVLGFVSFAVLTILGKSAHVEIISRIFTACSMGLFPVLIVLIVYQIPIDHCITRVLGKISLGIYVMQGILLDVFHSNLLYIANPYLYCLAVMGGTLVLAYLFQKIADTVYAVIAEK